MSVAVWSCGPLVGGCGAIGGGIHDLAESLSDENAINYTVDISDYSPTFLALLKKRKIALFRLSRPLV